MTEQVEVGNVEMVFDIFDGKVMQRFKEPMLVVLYDHVNATDVAMRMADLAFELREGVKPASDALKADLVERHRMKLTIRVALMLRTLREDKKKSDGQVAQAIVEACLKEVFS